MTARSLADRRAEDLETRRHAQREFQRPLVVEAGAGTGKTATLVFRIVAWCLGPGWQRALAERPEAPPRRLAARVLEGVAAITFTEAAAAEMAERVESTLRGVESGQVPPTLLLDSPASEESLCERARALRGSVDHLVVQTIHAWCRRLLGAHPVEAGLPPRFEVDADGRRRRAVVRELLEERLREAYARPGDPRLLELAVAGVGPGELEEVLLALLAAGVEAEDFAADPLSPARIHAEVSQLVARVDAFASSGIEAFQRGTRVANAQLLLDTTLGLQQRLADAPGDLDALASLCEWMALNFHETLVLQLRGYARGKFTKSESKALDGSEPQVQSAAGPFHEVLSGWMDLDVHLLAAQHEALTPLLAEAQARARARGFCSYEGLLSGCAQLLSRHPRVAAQVRGELDQLLVDEFQDTDARQCRIVAQLALEGPPGERPGLFVVGDPKQSIYGWRSADLAAYEDFVARVVEAGGEHRALSVNHRSVPAVLEEVERCIGPVMRPVPGLQPAFEPLVVSEANAGEPGFDRAGFAPVEHWLPVRWQPDAESPTRTRSQEATRIEARALARDLLRLREECGVSWRDVGVLFRGRGDWEIYLQELRAAGVLFNVEGDRNYFRRREIIDAIAWLRCVMDPGDEVALLAMLRSPSVGVPDAALQPLFATGLPARLRALRNADPAALGELLDLVHEVAANPPEAVPGLERVATWSLNLESALVQLGRLRESLVSDPGDVFVEKLRVHTLLEVAEAGRFLGSWRVANLERFFSELASRFAAGGPLQEILRDLREGVSLEERREEALLRDLVPDAVRVLTLHGAKGLAFDHVYLMQLHKSPGPDRRGVASRWLEGQLEYELHGSQTLGWARSRAARAAVADAERARLLYVGATRARERLVISGLPLADTWQGRRGSLSELMALREPERPDATEVVQRCLQAKSDRSLLAAALHVVPALHGDAEAPLRPRAAPALPDAARIEADEELLREARRSARARMQRPLASTASASGAPFPEGPVAAWGSAPGAGVEAGALGSAVHGVLEALDLSLPPQASLAGARAQLEARLPQWFGAAQLAAGRLELDALLEEIARGALFAHLFELGESVVARELPVLLRAGPDDAALAYGSGSIDLLYRDPLDGQLVVVDYKTDRAPDTGALEARAAHHAGQGRFYVRALRAAFALPADPRFELWFLRHDRCLVPDLSPR